MLAILRINKLSYDAKPVTVLAYAAFDHVADAQFFSDPSDIDCLALVSEGGTASSSSFSDCSGALTLTLGLVRRRPEGLASPLGASTWPRLLNLTRFFAIPSIVEVRDAATDDELDEL